MPDGPVESVYPMPLRHQPTRFGEPLKLLPVLFVLGTIVGLYTIYMTCHCLPMLQLMVAQQHVDTDMRQRAMIETIIFNIISFMLILCYIRCVLVHPGEVPEWREWLYDSKAPNFMDLSLQEKKKDGQRRHCKWCSKYKPDRCHHCRVCRTCILKMDHHCPWIYNCVGFHNYKYFFLLLFYVMLDVHFIFWTMIETFVRYVQVDTSFMVMFFTLFGLTLAFFLLTLVTAFFGFHCMLCMRGMTTIEFCEKKMPKTEMPDSAGDQMSVYNLGFCGNLVAVLGDDVCLWLVPFGQPPGDGLAFETNMGKNYSYRAYEVNRGIGRRPQGKTTKKGEQHYQRNAQNKLPFYGGTDYAAHDLITGQTLWGEKPSF